MDRIPNKIHWCWLSGEPIPESVKEYQKSWCLIGDNPEIKLWDGNSLDWTLTPKFVQQALEDKNWQTAADYVRAYALYTEGGWYFDSDIELIKKFPEEYFRHNFIATKEVTDDENFYKMMSERNFKNDSGSPLFGNGINAALMGAKPGLKYLKDVMDFYGTLDYSKKDYPGCLFGWYIAPQVYAFVAEKYGYTYEASEKLLDDDMFIAPEEFCTNVPYSKKNDVAFAHHKCHASWLERFQ